MTEKEITNRPATTATAGPEWEQRFYDLVATWKRDRGPHSASARLADHPAYQQIIEMGPEVVPLLLRELERQPDHWFRALHTLTGADPVGPEVAANCSKWRRHGCVGGESRGTTGKMAVNERLFSDLPRTGPDDDIEHVLEGLCGPLYGSVVQLLRRRLD